MAKVSFDNSLAELFQHVFPESIDERIGGCTVLTE
jgi:hypothetical protein